MNLLLQTQLKVIDEFHERVQRTKLPLYNPSPTKITENLSFSLTQESDTSAAAFFLDNSSSNVLQSITNKPLTISIRDYLRANFNSFHSPEQNNADYYGKDNGKDFEPISLNLIPL